MLLWVHACAQALAYAAVSPSPSTQWPPSLPPPFHGLDRAWCAEASEGKERKRSRRCDAPSLAEGHHVRVLLIG